MLARGESVPHFEVVSIDGTRVRYSSFWQHRNLVLAVVPDGHDQQGRDYVNRLAARAAAFSDLNTELVITHQAVAGVPEPGVIVADRWGEICFARAAGSVSELPEADDLVEWARYLQHQCPECEGEAR